MRQMNVKKKADELERQGATDVEIVNDDRVEFTDPEGKRAAYERTSSWGWRYIPPNG